MHVVVLCANSAASSFVVPRSVANVPPTSIGEGTTGFYGIFANEHRVYQYAASELAAQGLSIGDVIIGVRARSSLLSGPSTQPASDMNWADFTIQLGQAANTIASMSTTLSANLLNPVTVRTGPFTLPANSMPSGSGHTDFGYLMTFTTPYTYQGGDLVFSFAHGSAVGGPGFGQDAPNSFTGDGSLYRSLLVDANGVTGTFNNLMTALEFDTLNVPEPSTIALALIAFAALPVRRRKSVSCNRR
jgi:hypothetical protein